MSDTNEDVEICEDCEQRKFGDLVFHLLYCYDVYIISPPYPQNSKQNGIDIYLSESIVEPLELKGYNCYHGSRNITGGDYIIQAMSYPITIIPTTIVPVFKDKKFSNLRNLLLRPDYLERAVFLLFDASQAYPDAVSKNGYSLSVHDPYLLPKLIQTIEHNRKQTSLLQRKIKYEMGPNPASTVSSIPSEMCIERNSRSSLFDIFRIGRFFPSKGTMDSHALHEEGRPCHGKDRMDCHDSRTLHEEEECENVLSPPVQQSRCFSTAFKMDDGIYLEDLKSTTSPDVLLSHCHYHDEKISHFAARALTKIIQKKIDKFYKNVSLLRFETEVRMLLEKDYMKKCEINSCYEKLYFWILVAIYIRIYKYNDSDLKYHMKALTLRWYKTSTKPFEQSYQNHYLKLTISMIARIKAWPKRLEKHESHVQMLENCIALMDQNDFRAVRKPNMSTVVEYLIQLPRDIKHVFVVIITEKIFEKKYTEPCIVFFYQICASVRDKHQGTYLDVVERVTEYIQENYTKDIPQMSIEGNPLDNAVDAHTRINDLTGSVTMESEDFHVHVRTWMTEHLAVIQDNNAQMERGELTLNIKLLGILWDFLKDGKRKDEKQLTILKHFLKKLVYHPVSDVRNVVVPLLFSEDMNGIDVSQLGSSCIIVDEDLLETCIRDKLSLNYPDMVLLGQVPTTAENVLLFDATMPEGNTLVHVLRQKTLNDILQTNSTDSAYERFEEISRALAVCQGHRNIVTLKNLSANDVLPLFMLEHGKPLLQFLHEYENKLTWSQMIGILIDITSAVQHCHQNNIILCDINPASFVVTSGPDGFSTTKLSNFLHSKCIPHVENDDPCKVYIEEYNSICVEGEYKQPLAAYFSAPETLTGNYFSKSTEVWTLAATFYSVLLYGRQPFEELSHLQTSWFVREITSCHTPQMPGYFLPDLWKIISVNLDHKICNRMSIQSVLEELDTIKSTLEAKGDKIYHVRSVCPYLNSEDIQTVYRDLKGDFIEEKEEESTRQIYRDCCRRKNCLSELVSVRMGRKARKAIKALNHINILAVEEITTDSYTTKLVSVPFDSHSCILKRHDGNIKLDMLLSYFEQIVTALQYLHSQNILHCDLRCSYMYIDPIKGTLKLGHFGRAVLLEKNQTYVLKMMPSDAAPWSANEVKTNGMYSHASDIFNLASMFWETLNTQNKILPSLGDGSQRMYENLVKPPDSWQYSINKLMDCMKECWNINPTKRPTLDYIDKMIKELKQEAQRWSDEKTCSKFISDHAQSEGETYEDVTPSSHNTDPSMDYAWKSVVNELESGMDKNTSLIYDTYQNAWNDCTKARKHRGIIL